MDTNALQNQLKAFAAERDWDQFHSPKNLAMALAVESGELLELFQWLSPEKSEITNLSGDDIVRVKQELADITIYLLRLSDRLGIDLERAVVDKMAINAEKYPVDLSKGNATKYSRRSQAD